MEKKAIEEVAGKVTDFIMGLITINKEQAEQAAKTIMDNGKRSKPEVRKFVDELVGHAEAVKTDFLKMAQEKVNGFLKDAEKATRPKKPRQKKTAEKKG